MKRFTAAALLAVLIAASLWAVNKSVQVNTAQIRQSPSFLGPVVAELTYGDQVEIIDEGRGWLQVRSAAGDVGWVQESALTSKKVVLSSTGNVSSGASSEEVALAGKGFNSEIEQEYKSQSDLDFSWVDKMEQWEIAAEDLADFLAEGDLEGVIQ